MAILHGARTIIRPNTRLRRTPRVISLAAIAMVESAIRTPLNPKIRGLLSSIAVNIPHESLNKDCNVKHNGVAATEGTMPLIICTSSTRRGRLDEKSDLGYEIFAWSEKEKEIEKEISIKHCCCR
jgi:hypothetical protein